MKYRGGADRVRFCERCRRQQTDRTEKQNLFDHLENLSSWNELTGPGFWPLRASGNGQSKNLRCQDKSRWGAIPLRTRVENKPFNISRLGPPMPTRPRPQAVHTADSCTQSERKCPFARGKLGRNPAKTLTFGPRLHPLDTDRLSFFAHFAQDESPPTPSALPHRQRVGWPILYGFIVKGGLSNEARPSFPNPFTPSASKNYFARMRLVIHLLH